MRSALANLGLDRLTVFYPGSKVYELAARVRVVPLTAPAEGDSAILFRPKRGRSR
jgi:hypothetical protein